MNYNTIRVLVVFTNPVGYNDGATCVILNYIRYMDLKGLQVDFAGQNNVNESFIKELNSKGCNYFKLGKRSKLITYVWNLLLLLRNYDVVHVNGNSATTTIELFAGLLAKNQCRIVHIHNSMTAHPFIHKLLLPLFRLSYTKGLACSTMAGDWIFGKDNFTVLCNAIDVDKYLFSNVDRKMMRKKLNIPSNYFVIGHVGMFNEQKNHGKLLSIFYSYVSKHPNSFLLLVGDGPQMNIVLDEIKFLGLDRNVMVMGIRTDIPQLLSVMDFFVFPSKWEGLGLAVVEAQASGLPCIVSDKVPNDVAMSNAIRFLSLDVSDDKWVEIIEKMELRDRMSQCRENFTFITNAGYSIKEEANKLRNIYVNYKKRSSKDESPSSLLDQMTRGIESPL